MKTNDGRDWLFMDRGGYHIMYNPDLRGMPWRKFKRVADEVMANKCFWVAPGKNIAEIGAWDGHVFIGLGIYLTPTKIRIVLETKERMERTLGVSLESLKIQGVAVDGQHKHRGHE